MVDPSDLEARLSAVEARVEEVAADAAAARHLAAAGDRDLADLTTKVEALRSALTALAVQTRERFDEFDRRLTRLEERVARLDERVDSLEQKVDAGFGEMRGKFDQLAGGQQRMVDLLSTLIDAQGGR